MILGVASLYCAVGVIAAITVAAAIGMVRSACREPRAGVRPAVAWLLGAGAFALVWGASLITVDNWAFSHPFWDQWWEGKTLYEPFVRGTYTWSQLLSPHNEHRIALTRLWALLFFHLDGQWDNRTVAAANTLLHALPVGLLTAALACRHRSRDAALITLVLVIPSALPLARDNVLLGFQSQFYFLLLYVPLALWLMIHRKPSEPGFWLGVLCGVLALFSVGSGPTCGVALLATVALESLRSRSTLRARLPLITVALALATVGWLCRVYVPYLVPAHAHSVGQLLKLALRCWAFPFTRFGPLALVLWAPALAWLALLLREKRPWTLDERFTAALGIFIFLHGALIGWARANDSPDPANRYFDVLALGLLINALAGIALLRRRAARGPRLALAGWVMTAAAGVFVMARSTYQSELPHFRGIWREQEHNVRSYVHSRDRAALTVATPWEIPHWSADELRVLLDDPFIRSILPWSVRERLPVELVDANDSGFSSPGLPPDPDHVYRSPPIPIADWQKYKSAHHGTKIRVKVAATSFPFLRFGVVGEATRGVDTLTLIDERGQRTPVNLLRERPLHVWTSVTAPAPAGPFTVEAESPQWDLWWGFSAPSEAGPLSGRLDYIHVTKYLLIALGLFLWSAAVRARFKTGYPE